MPDYPMLTGFAESAASKGQHALAHYFIKELRTKWELP